MFRPVRMQLVRIYVPIEHCKEAVNELGNSAIAHFKLTENPKEIALPFDERLKLIESLQNKISQIEKEIVSAGMSITSDLIIPGSFSMLNSEISMRLDRIHKIHEFNSTYLGHATTLLEKMNVYAQVNSIGSVHESSLRMVVGTIPISKVDSLRGVLWRGLFGNVHLTHESCIVPSFCEERIADSIRSTVVFVAFVHGNSAFKKCASLSTSLGATLYDPVALGPLEHAKKKEKFNPKENEDALKDICRLLMHNTYTLREELSRTSKLLFGWKATLLREQRLQTVLRGLDYRQSTRCVVGECWVPCDLLHDFSLVTTYAGTDKGYVVLYNNVSNEGLTPPTLIRLPRVFTPFQLLIDSYGIPSYDELNPMVFTVITFPLMFGVMYGDAGHGAVLLLCALYVNHNKNSRLYSSRTLLFMMGICAVYLGIVYNDFFSRSIRLFRSSPYPFGIDPRWHSANNGDEFLNDYKMKQALVLGCVQMILGMILSSVNTINRRDYLELLAVVVPQTLFGLCCWGYCLFLILKRWVDPSMRGVSLINVVLALFFTEKESFEGQAQIESLIRKVLIVSIPWMLFTKPTILFFMGNSVSEVLVHQLVLTLEFVVSVVSNTASYLRLWALSLAHAQLGKVFWDMLIEPTRERGGVVFIICSVVWVIVSLAVLVGMEGMSAALHALRLHWIEFNGKFYKGEGYRYEPLDTSKSGIIRALKEEG